MKSATTAVLSLAALTLGAPTSTTKDKFSIVERDGTQFNVFNHAETGASMQFVNNSGICETTPGVNQYSGYLSVGENKNMWYDYSEPFLYVSKIDQIGSGFSSLEITRPLPLLRHGSMVDLDAAA